jgi:hypothetical protein
MLNNRTCSYTLFFFRNHGVMGFVMKGGDSFLSFLFSLLVNITITLFFLFVMCCVYMLKYFSFEISIFFLIANTLDLQTWIGCCSHSTHFHAIINFYRMIQSRFDTLIL